jgi:hypothetical protein
MNRVARRVADKPKDLVLAVTTTEDGDGLKVLRRRRDTVEVGEMRRLEEGRPVHGEVVRLSPRPELPVLFDAETVMEAPATSKGESRAGPAQVASDRYRKNWDAIWRRRSKAGSSALN